MDQKLTIILPLKDRTSFALRWMHFANKEQYSFKIILADGGTDNTAREIFANSSYFQNLNYIYIRYPADTNYTAYYKKISDAIALVDTPYLLMADDDDFYCAEGLMRSIEFLDENPDYVSARGHYKGFSVKVPRSKAETNTLELYGELKLNGLVYPSVTHNQKSAAERIESYFTTWTPNWYNVSRTKNFSYCWNKIKALNFSDIFLMEHALSGLIVSEGKTYAGTFPYYYRQFGEHYLTESKIAVAREGDFFERILSETWLKNYWLLISALSSGIQSQDGLNEEEARRIARFSYKKFLAAIVFGALDPYTKKTSGPPVKKLSTRRRVKKFFRSFLAGHGPDWYTPRIKNFLYDATLNK